MSYALITGASSGIGREFAHLLEQKGYDLILVARREELLNELKNELKCDVVVFPYDLSIEDNCKELIEKIKEYNISIFINNAGYGECGYIMSTSYEKELNMIDLNIRCVYILTKMMLSVMKKGHILNVASVAGLLPAGPYMSQYYATKAYVRSLSEGINYELRKNKSNIYVSALCPGPVDTEFNDVANVKFALKGISAKKCVTYAYKKMMKNKTVIVPTFKLRLALFSQRFVSRKCAIKIAAHQQQKKM